MARKIFKSGNSLVVSLPKDTLDILGLTEGTEVSVEVDRGRQQIVISRLETPLPGVDESFARQVNEFIEEYRPALEALANQ